MEGIAEIFSRLQAYGQGQVELMETEEEAICFQLNVFVDRLLLQGKTDQADWIWSKTMELSALKAEAKAEKETEELDLGKREVGGNLLMNYGTYLASTSRYMDAIATFERVIETYPQSKLHVQAKDNKENAKSYILDRWHYRMLNDRPRNSSYFKSIEWALRRLQSSTELEHLHVLDIGGGTGLLSMYAVLLGAEHVYCIEMNPELAKMAQKCIQHNGMEDQITVISKHSKDVIVGQDIPCEVNLIVTELVDSGIYTISSL